MVISAKVRIRAPASSANLGPGFDVFALALQEPFDVVEMSRSNSRGIEVQVEGENASTIPIFTSENSGGLVAEMAFKKHHLTGGCRIKILKGVRPGFGLGSSAASAAAVAYGLNVMFDLKMTSAQLVALAAEGERASAGVAHFDNVSASLLGGFVIVAPDSGEAITLRPPPSLKVAIAYPLIPTPPKKTGVARSVIPRLVDVKSMTHNVAAAASMVAGIMSGDIGLVGRSMSDVVVEPARQGLVPSYGRVKEEALRSGASGVAISGAGPAVISLLDGSKVSAVKVAEAMERGFRSEGLEAYSFTTSPGEGATLLEKS